METISDLSTKRKILIYIAEDDDDDRVLLEEAISRHFIHDTSLQFALNGEDLIDQLKGGKRLPDLIILDLNMPKMDGRAALRQIKNDESFKHLPIVVLSTSSAPEDIKFIYDHGGNTFITKPSRFSELEETVEAIKRYWFEQAVLIQA